MERGERALFHFFITELRIHTVPSFYFLRNFFSVLLLKTSWLLVQPILHDATVAAQCHRLYDMCFLRL